MIISISKINVLIWSHKWSGSLPNIFFVIPYQGTTGTTETTGITGTTGFKGTTGTIGTAGTR